MPFVAFDICMRVYFDDFMRLDDDAFIYMHTGGLCCNSALTKIAKFFGVLAKQKQVVGAPFYRNTSTTGCTGTGVCWLLAVANRWTKNAHRNRGGWRLCTDTRRKQRRNEKSSFVRVSRARCTPVRYRILYLRRIECKHNLHVDKFNKMGLNQ